MGFGMIIFNQNIVAIPLNEMQNYATLIQIVLSYILRLEMFMKTLQMMLKKDLIQKIMQPKARYQWAKI